MYTVYQVHPEELDDRFLQALKLLFQGKQIEIAVRELATVETEDETTYLLKSPANREQLLTAIANVAKGENLLTIDLDNWHESSHV
jgi:predicted RNA binding protein with dsRBD fold (UPF0201 family)